MVEFGILSAIRQLVCQEKIGCHYGLSKESIYMMVPHIVPNTWPAIFLELEESWHSNIHTKPKTGKVVLKISILSNSKDGIEALDIANQIRQLIDGISLELKSDYEATFRMNSSIVDIKKIVDIPRKVEQYYEAFIYDRHFNCLQKQ